MWRSFVAAPKFGLRVAYLPVIGIGESAAFPGLAVSMRPTAAILIAYETPGHYPCKAHSYEVSHSLSALSHPTTLFICLPLP